MSAKEVNARAAAWVEQADREDLNDETRAALDAWLAQSPAHRIAYWRLNSAWGHTELLGALNPPAGQTGERRARVALTVGKMAAVIAVIAILGGAAAVYFASPRDRVYSTQIGGRETVTFADGSRIELNTNTRLRARMTTEERVVWLEKGEAYFQVKHDAVHPFIVIADGHRITDLGTKFLVRTDSGKLQVAVTQGRVWLDEAGRQMHEQSAMLSAGDIATATAQSVSVTKQVTRALATELAWRKGLLIFKHTTLADAAVQFNRYNTRKLVIADEKTGRLTIDGTFPTTDVAAFTDAAQTVFRLQVQYRGNEIVISR